MSLSTNDLLTLEENETASLREQLAAAQARIKELEAALRSENDMHQSLFSEDK